MSEIYFLPTGRKCASSWGRCHTLQRTTPQPMGWLNAFIVRLKQLCKCNDNPTAWYENLGVFLLGIHSMVKEDIGCSSSELALRTTLRLPGQFFSDNDKTVSHTEYRRRLLTFMKSLKPSLLESHVVVVPIWRRLYALARMSLCETMVLRRRCNRRTQNRSPFSIFFFVFRLIPD